MGQKDGPWSRSPHRRQVLGRGPWLEVPRHTELIKALVRGDAEAYVPQKAFLFEIVANPRSGLDVDKIDYYQRDSYYSGVTKVAFG